jgi:rare lipoprotein A
MTTAKPTKTLIPLLALACLAVPTAPARAATSAGGTSPAGGTSSEGASSGPPVVVEELTPLSATAAATSPVTLTIGKASVQVGSSALLGQKLAFAGTAPARYASRTMAIERLSTQGTWSVLASAHVNRRGAFAIYWRANAVGRLTVRLAEMRTKPKAGHNPLLAVSRPSQLSVYQPAISTWFGPGFYGKTTACGQTLTTLTIGVASPTLPCGTLIEVSYADKRLTVPVIDRGPYGDGASWDLTTGAAQALGVLETVEIGTLVVGATPNVATLGTPPGEPAPAQPAPAPGASGGTAPS